ncbi:MAG: thioredoxin [Candidatus Pacebacteria bacterium]|nr:thioredoxin [Candidatus Paceibacterota bacterium]
MELTDENFEKELKAAEKPILVDFFATWCGPCSILSPILEKVAKDFSDKIIFAKVNVDVSPISSQKYNISQIPTVILFKEGRAVASFIGAMPEEEVKKWLEDALG